MRMYAFICILTIFLVLSSSACETAPSQAQTTRQQNNRNAAAVPSEDGRPNESEKEQGIPIASDSSEHYSIEYLKHHYKEASVVAYIDSKEVLSVGSSDEYTDCSYFPQKSPGNFGYCSFVMRAEIKELYKGKLLKRSIEYSEYGEAGLIQRKGQFLGEQVVFLETSKSEGGKTYYQVIENSSRDIEYDILSKMRKVAAANVKQ